MAQTLIQSLGRYPVIASVKSADTLVKAMESKCPVLAILYGTVTNIDRIVSKAKQSGKQVLVNLDMVDGYSARPTVIDDLKSRCDVDGILSSKAPLVRAGKAAGLTVGQRFFVIDSFAYHQLLGVLKQSKPDFLEILPGCVPRVIGWIKEQSSIPIVAGGLVCDTRDVQAVLAAGATSVATSDQSLWNLPTKNQRAEGVTGHS